jgi:hypothetical protein
VATVYMQVHGTSTGKHLTYNPGLHLGSQVRRVQACSWYWQGYPGNTAYTYQLIEWWWQSLPHLPSKRAALALSYPPGLPADDSATQGCLSGAFNGAISNDVHRSTAQVYGLVRSGVFQLPPVSVLDSQLSSGGRVVGVAVTIGSSRI